MDVVKQALIILKMIEINITENNNRLIMNESDDIKYLQKV